jgi:hypothetical protein
MRYEKCGHHAMIREVILEPKKVYHIVELYPVSTLMFTGHLLDEGEIGAPDA